MCAVSAIGDDWRLKYPNPTWPGIIPDVPGPPNPDIDILATLGYVRRKEFEELKKEVARLREELQKAKQQDIDEGNPDCEMDDKVDHLEKLANLVGETVLDILKKATKRGKA